MTLGRNFTDRLFVLVHVDQTSLATPDSLNTYTLRHGDVLARCAFLGPRSLIHPFLIGGLTAQSATATTYAGNPGSYAFSGLAARVGGGAQLVLWPGTLAVDLTVVLTDGSFNSVRGGAGSLPSITTKSVRAYGGVTYGFGRTR